MTLAETAQLFYYHFRPESRSDQAQRYTVHTHTMRFNRIGSTLRLNLVLTVGNLVLFTNRSSATTGFVT